MENGVFIHVVLPFLLLICRFFAGRVSLSHISERRKEKREKKTQRRRERL